MAMGGGKEMEIAIKIAGKVEKSFNNALGQAVKGLGSITKAVSATTAAAAAAVGAIGIAAIKTGMEFETAMSQVAATMLIDKTTEEGQKAFERLENAARECGASTAFSATEAAEALNYLALAGYTADEAAIALPTVLKLAGAGAMELAAASDMVTDSMSALGIEATDKNLTDFADQMAKAASKSNTSVSQLGEAILTVGGTAKDLAGGTVELNTALGILADNGIKASEGGTHLRNMILSLQTARNGDAAKLFKKMGLSAYNAQGEMRSLGDIFGDLNASLAGANAKKVNSVLSTIFKQTDLASARAMLAATTDSIDNLQNIVDATLVESGTSIAKLGINLQDMANKFDTTTTEEEFAAEMLSKFGMNSEQAMTLFTGLQSVVSGTGNRFNELSKEIENSAGACEKMYAIQLDNLNGDIDILKSGLSDLGISIYKDLNGPLREMTKLATSMVGELSEAYKIDGMEGMVGAIGGCLSKAVSEIAEYAPQIISMGVDLIESFVQGIADNTGSLADAAVQAGIVFMSGLFSLIPQVMLAGIDIIIRLASSITSLLPELINNGIQAITNFATGITQRLPEISTTALTLVQTLANSIGTNAPQLISAAILLISNLTTGILSMLPQILQIGIQLILSLAQGLISNLPFILQMGVQIILSLVSGITQMLPMIIQGGIQLIISLIQGIIANLGNIAQAAVQIILSLVTGLISAIPQLTAAVPQLVGAIIDTILSTNWLDIGIQIIKELIDGILSTGKSLWSAIKSLFTGGEVDIPDVSSQSTEVINSYASGISDTGAITTAANSMIANTFIGIDTSQAMIAGTQVGATFSAGLTNSMLTSGLDAKTALNTGFNNGLIPANTNNILDTTVFGANMTTAGIQGAIALNAGFNTGLIPADTNSILDTTVLGIDMTTAGIQGAMALNNGINTGLKEIGINNDALIVDTSKLTTTLTNAGVDGVTAISTGMIQNSNAMLQAVTTLETDINSSLDDGWEIANSNAQTAMQHLITTVKNAAHSAVNAIKTAFENMIITIPKPRIPIISVSTSSISYGDSESVSIPNFSVSWNALGGIFNQPTIFNTPAGMQGVGEAGPEAILPLDTLWTKMKEILNEAIATSGGASLVDTFIEKLKGIKVGGGGKPELAGSESLSIVWNPTYNLYGSAGKQEIIEADHMSQIKFNKRMKQYEKDKKRRDL